ncbi:putative chaperone-modulator protein CbpM [Legionella lansingensis]|uniref:Putative chaperone-modulator protein CbpM n=1 Tax=Legionella lansingensis TaxID=45067 RepID=A0A0W0VXH4_9GAMM|nr:chaperone modulator CbpM [Legionella lansingensis]KTD24723.1 putative chaperone-modulator protein CbpM [Legionella lansingensis]SNV53567.1 putative chaperone-modulator protein CbpM [Legionella lansingensis]
MPERNKGSTALECEDWFYLSLREVTSSFGVSKQIILEIIDEGIINVKKDEKEGWLFDSEAVACIRTVLRLHRDLGVNLAGAGLALQLLKEIERLEMLLNHLNQKS